MSAPRFEAWVHAEDGHPLQGPRHAVTIEVDGSAWDAAGERAKDWWVQSAVIPAQLVVVVKEEDGGMSAFEITPELRPKIRQIDVPVIAESEAPASVDESPTEPAPRPAPDDECGFHKVTDKIEGRDKLALTLRIHGEVIDGKITDAAAGRKVMYVFNNHERVRAFARQLLGALEQIPEVP